LIEIGRVPERGAPAGLRPRLTERHVLALGLVMSGGFVAAAAVVAVLTVAAGGSHWAAVHLALAGAGTVAIGAFMPHFAVTLAGTRPSAWPLRLGSLVLLAAGGGLAVLGFTLAGPRWAAAGALLQVTGLGIVGWHTVAPWREPLARRHVVVGAAYLVALLELGAGIAIGGLAALGVEPVLAGWASLRATHAWLTFFGGMSLTIFATLVYLAPTVLGARIRATPGLVAGLAGIVAGPPLAAVGFGLVLPVIAAGGAAVTLAGGIGQILVVVDAYRRRGRFTSEHDWRRVAAGHLLAGPAWFAAAAGTATIELATGRPLAGWSLGALVVPLVAGWLLQILVGSWTHLVPAVTPGDPAAHARQRRILAAASGTRLVAWNAGVAVLWSGVALRLTAVAALGGALLGTVVALSVATLGASVWTLRRRTGA
jgi:nitrite reductase (NO-forming)